MKSYDFNLQDVVEAFNKGENVIHFMQERYQGKISSAKMVEIAYDLQAGAYIKWFNHDYAKAFTDEHLHLIKTYFPDIKSVLDVGCGELTNSQALFNKMDFADHFFACDISWSRCYKGRDFYRSMTDDALYDATQIFVSEMLHLPFQDNAIDLIVTAHALEPNHGYEKPILEELLRVARFGLVLFEPSFELSTDEQKNRMISHGYIRGLPTILEEMEQADLLYHELTSTCVNPLNKVAAYVIAKKNSTKKTSQNIFDFSDPVSKRKLVKEKNYLFSPDRGVSYPILEDIPILRPDSEIISSALLHSQAK